MDGNRPSLELKLMHAILMLIRAAYLKKEPKGDWKKTYYICGKIEQAIPNQLEPLEEAVLFSLAFVIPPKCLL